MKIGYVIRDSFGVTRDVGKNCAKYLTGQIKLIDDLYSEMRSLDGKRKRFCNHRSAKKWSVPLNGGVWKGCGGEKWRWEINAFGYHVRINETVHKDCILILNGKILMVNGKPRYWDTMDDAKLYFFDVCAGMRINEILKKHNVV